MNGIQSLHYKFSMDESQIKRTQEHWDNFGECWKVLHGSHDETNYIADAITGVFRFFLKRYGSVYPVANIGLEANMGVVQNAYGCHTNHSSDSTIEQLSSIFLSKMANILERFLNGARKKLINEGHEVVKRTHKIKDLESKNGRIKDCWFDKETNRWKRRTFIGYKENGRRHFRTEIFEVPEEITDPEPKKKRNKRIADVHQKLTKKGSTFSELILNDIRI